MRFIYLWEVAFDLIDSTYQIFISRHVILPVFTRIPVFQENPFKILIAEMCVKIM